MNGLTAISALALVSGATAFALPGGDTCSSGKSAGSCQWSQKSDEMIALGAMSETPGNSAKKDIIDTAVSAGKFNTLAAALKTAGLIDALKSEGPFTVFAPTDDAFAKLPKGTVETLLKPENRGTLTSILKYHVASGNVMAAKVVKLDNATTLNGQRVDIKVKDGTVMIDNAKVVVTDIKCSNGVIHVIDSVILPEDKNVVELARAAGKFNTLIAAVNAAELGSLLSSEGPFTVFAPTDEAFAKLPAGTVETLLKPENREALIKVLTYHVVPGRKYASDVLGAGKLQTAEGSKISIRQKSGTAMVNDATILATDIEASNGVIHVIDSVILPPDM